MVAPSNSAQTWRAAFTGSYDDEVIEEIVPFIEPESIVLDVGASLGFYAVPLGIAARKVGAQVLAIEPVRRNCEVLRLNIQQNDLGGVVTILECALGRARSTVTLHVETGGTGNAAVVTGLDPSEVAMHDEAGNSRSAETARMVPLDDLPIPESFRGRRCSLIKMDTEGYEFDILFGAKAFVDVHQPVILAEFSPAWLESRGFSRSAPYDWARSNGYSCLELTSVRRNAFLDRRRITQVPVTGHRRTDCDILMTPGSSQPFREGR